MAKVIIERNAEWDDTAREIGIYIDGGKVGIIDYGEIQEFSIESGKHEIFVKYDWWHSQKIKLNMAEQSTTTLKLSGYKYGAYVLPIALGTTLTYFLVRYTMNLSFNFLLGLGVVVLLYPMFFMTLGRNRYYTLTQKE